MNTTPLPLTGFISLSQIIGRAEIPEGKASTKRKRKGNAAKPAIEGLLTVSRTTWWRGVKSGRYPQGVKISARRTAWRAEDIQNLLNSFK